MPDQQTPASESLLTQILLLVQNLSAEVESLRKHITSVEKSVNDMQNQMSELISTAFVDGDLKRHRLWHARRWLSRIFNWS